MVTLKDIAAAAGVSTSAVCKALRDGYDISDELKAKVQKLVVDLDYKPNMLARAFRTKRTFNIGTYYAFESTNTLTHTFFTSVLNAFSNRIAVEGYDLTYISARVGKNKTSILSHCEMKNFEGVLLACVDYNDPAIKELVDGNIPIVCIDNYFGKGVCVTSDNYSGIKMLVEYCIESGHRDICYVHGQDGYTTSKRIQGFKDTMESNGLKVDDSNLIKSEYYSAELTEQIFQDLMNRPNPPSCIIFPDDFCAATAVKIAKKMKIKIPNDVSIAGYDSAEFSSLISPNIATVAQDAKMIGKHASDCMIKMIEKRSVEHEIVVPVTLIKGETIKDIR